MWLLKENERKLEMTNDFMFHYIDDVPRYIDDVPRYIDDVPLYR
jgi:hypothetical protein